MLYTVHLREYREGIQIRLPADEEHEVIYLF